MKSIISTVSRRPVAVADTHRNGVNKPAQTAHNHADFKRILDHKINASLHEHISATKSGRIAGETSNTAPPQPIEHEYNNFRLNANRGLLAGRISMKRSAKGFHPLPAGRPQGTTTGVNIHGRPSTVKAGSQKGVSSVVKDISQQIAKYREDQLLTSPGGDRFFLARSGNVIDIGYDHALFTNRVGKDIRDSYDNLRNLIKDLGSGREIKYLDHNGKIKRHRRQGLTGAAANLISNIVSGISMGAYTPANETKPEGISGRIKHFFKKVFVEAVGKDMITNIPRSIVSVGEDALFAGLNLMEVIPDATIGNTRLGRNITTRIFDDLQVAVDFATDVMPGGGASTRTKAFLTGKIMGSDDGRDDQNSIQLTRSTPFRRVIEAISLITPFRI